MAKKIFKYVIITDEDNRPMAWSENSFQLCYCTDHSWKGSTPHPVEAYTIAKAIRLIEKSKAMRKKNNFSPTVYKTMPFNNTLKKKIIYTLPTTK